MISLRVRSCAWDRPCFRDRLPLWLYGRPVPGPEQTLLRRPWARHLRGAAPPLKPFSRHQGRYPGARPEGRAKRSLFRKRARAWGDHLPPAVSQLDSARFRAKPGLSSFSHGLAPGIGFINQAEQKVGIEPFRDRRPGAAGIQRLNLGLEPAGLCDTLRNGEGDQAAHGLVAPVGQVTSSASRWRRWPKPTQLLKKPVKAP